MSGMSLRIFLSFWQSFFRSNSRALKIKAFHELFMLTSSAVRMETMEIKLQSFAPQNWVEEMLKALRRQQV